MPLPTVLLAIALASGCAASTTATATTTATTTTGGLSGADRPPVAQSLTVPADGQEAVVVRVSDGDTLVLRGIGAGPVPAAATKVRLIGVDTPEVFASERVPDVPQCFGPEASRRTKLVLAEGTRVRVAGDREARDRFGRVLVYLWGPDGRNLEEDLLASGLARVFVVRPNTAHATHYAEVEQVARAARVGLWGAC